MSFLGNSDSELGRHCDSTGTARFRLNKKCDRLVLESLLGSAFVFDRPIHSADRQMLSNFCITALARQGQVH